MSRCLEAADPSSRRCSAGFGVALDVDDQRVSGEPLALRFQRNAHAGSGAGRASAARARLSAFSSPRPASARPSSARIWWPRGAAARWSWSIDGRCSTSGVAQLSVFLGIDPKEIGQIGAGKRDPTGRIDVAMIQSLVRKESVADLVAGYGQVIVDECHHLPAVSFERVLVGGEGALRRRAHRNAAAPRWAPSHHPDAARSGALRGEREDAGGPAPVRAPAHRARDRLPSFDVATDGGIQESLRARWRRTRRATR